GLLPVPPGVRRSRAAGRCRRLRGGVMSQTVSVDAGPLDDPDVFVVGVPHDLLARLRTEAPVHLHPDGNGGGRFIVTTHRFVRELNRDWPRFSSAQLTVA